MFEFVYYGYLISIHMFVSIDRSIVSVRSHGEYYVFVCCRRRVYPNIHWISCDHAVNIHCIEFLPLSTILMINNNNNNEFAYNRKLNLCSCVRTCATAKSINVTACTFGASSRNVVMLSVLLSIPIHWRALPRTRWTSVKRPQSSVAVAHTVAAWLYCAWVTYIHLIRTKTHGIQHKKPSRNEPTNRPIVSNC